MGEGRWLVWIVIGLAGLAGGARAEDRARAWTGAWLVEGSTERVYLGATDEGLVHERALRSPDGTSVWDLEVHGAPRGAKAELEGTVRMGDGRQPARLQAARGADGTLDVSLTAGSSVVRRERWVRAGPATLALRVVGGATVTPDGVLLRGVHEEAPLDLELVTGGRPQALLLTVAAIDTGTYPKLDDLVAWQPLVGRRVEPVDDELEPADVDEPFVDDEQVPVGLHPLRWDGRDRGEGEPIRPGTYRLVVASLDAPIGPAGAETQAAPVVLTLHVLPAEFEEEAAPEAGARPVVAEVARRSAGGFVRRTGR